MMRQLLSAIFLFTFCQASAQPRYKTIVSNGEKDIIPEGIAVDEATGIIYVGSMAKNKIIIIDTMGKAKDFVVVNARREGLTDVSGIKVDKKRRWIWVVSTVINGKQYATYLKAFEISTGKFKKSFEVKDTVKHLFNDLVLDNQGNIYCTDTYFGAVYKANPEANNITLLVKDSLTAYPNGIALGNNQQLYIATYSHGLIRYDLATKKLSKLTGYKDLEMAYNLDGLGFRNNILYAVYNSAGHKEKNAVIKYMLNEQGTEIIDEKTIDQGNPLFRKPTTFALINERLYLLAATNIDEYNENKNSVMGIEDKLVSPTILVYDLR